jgi:hypothetical protein
MGDRRYDRYMDEEYRKYIESGGDDVPLPDDRVEPVTLEELEAWDKLYDELNNDS